MRRAFAILVVCAGAFATDANSAGKAAPPPFVAEPMSVDVLSLRGMMRGHDFARLAMHAMNAPKRAEFESTADFSERLARFTDKPAYGTVRLSDRVLATGLLSNAADRLDGIHYEYNADAGRFKLCLSEFPSAYIGEVRESASPIRVRTTRKSLGSYVGTNAFGVRTRVQKYSSYTLQIVVPQEILRSQCFESAEMGPNEAKDATSGMWWGMIGTLRPPYYFSTEDYETPTVTSPTEEERTFGNMPFDVEQVVVFNPVTGEIRYRARTRE